MIPDPDRRQNLSLLFVGPLPTLPENFMQIRLEVFAQCSQQTDRQTTTKTSSLIGGGNKRKRVPVQFWTDSWLQ